MLIVNFGHGQLPPRSAAGFKLAVSVGYIVRKTASGELLGLKGYGNKGH